MPAAREERRSESRNGCRGWTIPRLPVCYCTMKLPGRRFRALGIGLIVAIAAARTAAGEVPAQLVADLSPSQPSTPSYPSPVAQLGSVAFFTAEESQHGRELWRTEGTPETTRLVADLCPGTCSAVPTVAVAGGKLFVFAFTGWDSALFTTDGTTTGTRLVRRFHRAALFSSLVAFDGRVWFVINQFPPNRYELWQSDGTTAGTAAWPVDCGPGCNPVGGFLGAAGDELFFGVTTTGDYHLWRTDGTVGGTRAAEPGCPPSCVSLFSPIGVAGGHYYFAGSDAAHGQELWVAGGGLPAPRMVADLTPGADSTYFTFGFEFAGEAWIWVTAGGPGRWYRLTPTSAVVATEVEPLGAAHAPYVVWPAGDRLYFAVPGDPSPVSLWTVRPGIEAPRQLMSGLQSAGRVGEVDGLELIQIYRPGGDRPHLVVTDGTVAGTREIDGVSPLPVGNLPSLVTNGGILISGDDGVHGFEPWTSDGTAAGTRPLGDLRRTTAGGPRPLAAVGDEVAFTVGTVSGSAGQDLYAAGAAPGAPPSARLLLAGSSFGELAGSGGKLFAVHQEPATGEPSLLIAEPATGAMQSAAVGSLPFHLTPWRNGVAFGEYADDEPLWTSDGTVAGTRKVLDLVPGYSPFCPILCPYQIQFPTEITPVGDRLYFVAADGNEGSVWTSDGTAAGTVPLTSPLPYEYVLDQQLTPFQGGIAYVRYGTAEIWTSHGTVESTRAATAVGTYPLILGAVGNRLVYSTYSPANDAYSLWATDGTAAGTVALHDLGGAAVHPWVSSQRLQTPSLTPPLVVRDRVFFTVDDDTAGDELWVSDGTAAGTRRVADLRPGPIGSYPRSLAAYRGCALFAATDGVGGYEPWASDGASAWRVADVAPGEAASTPEQITPAGGFVYFTADNGAHGREVFAVATTELDARCAVQPPIGGPPPGSFTSAAAPGFAFLVKIGPSAAASTGVSAPCVNGMVCATGTAGGRGDVFIRMVATTAGRLAPAIVKLTPEAVEVTVYQTATGAQKVYQLAATAPPSTVLAGVLGRDAFAANAAAASARFAPMTSLGDASSLADAASPARGGAGARWFSPRDIAGYRFKAWLVDASGRRQAVRGEGCLPGTLCFSGPVTGRTDVLVRVLDRRPAAARLTGAGLELWVERTKTHELRKFLLPAESAASTSLNGVLDATGFRR